METVESRAEVELILRAMEPRLRGLALRCLGRPADVDDLVQEVYVRTLAGADRFRGEADRTTWIYRIATNVIADWMRSPFRRGRRPLVDRPDARAGPREGAEKREERERVRRAPRKTLAAAVVATIALLVLALRGGSPSPHADGVYHLRKGEKVHHSGTRTYVAEHLESAARVSWSSGSLHASHARFQIEEKTMRTRTRYAAGGVVATVVVVAIYWGSIDVTDRAGRQRTLIEGRHVLDQATPAEKTDLPEKAGVPFDPATGITGIVLDPQERPVEGARIEVAAMGQASYVGNAPDQVAASDADGRFEIGPLPDRIYTVTARKSEVGAAGPQEFPGPGADLILRLVPGARLEGRVYDVADGAPVERVLLTAQMIGGRWTFERVVTGKDGRFALEHLDPEEASLWGRSPSHREFVLRPPLRVGETTKLEIPLRRTEVLRGQVIDATTEAPLKLIAVHLPRNPQRHARLLGEGRFEIAVARNLNTLFVLAEGYPETIIYVQLGERDKTFRIHRGKLVRVSVIDGDGRPLSDAEVTVQPKWIPAHVQPGPKGSTDEHGRVELQLAWTRQHPQQPMTPAKLDVTAHKQGYYGSTVSRDLEDGHETEATVRLEPAATLEGRLLDEAGRPVSGARCSVGDPYTSHSGREGRFAIRNIPPKTATLRVNSARFASLKRSGLALRGGKTLSVGDLVLEPGVQIAGRVVDVQGSPVKRYKVWVGKWPVLHWGRLDAGGRFTIGGLGPNAAYEVHVRAGGAYETTPDVAAGTSDLLIRLESLARIEGRAVSPQGEAVPLDLRVLCMPIGRRQRSDIPLAFKHFTDGTFHGDLPAGRYRLSASGGEWLLAPRVEVEAEAGQTTQVTLTLVIGGRVVGRVERPQAATAYALNLYADDLQRPVSSAAIKADSTFSLGPIAPGRYTLALPVYKPGYRGARQVVDVVARQAVRCNLAVVVSGHLLVHAAKAGQELALLDAGGEPVPLSNPERNRTRASLPTKPGADGTWRRYDLLPGSYQVRHDGTTTPVEIRSGETTELDLR